MVLYLTLRGAKPTPGAKRLAKKLDTTSVVFQARDASLMAKSCQPPRFFPISDSGSHTVADALIMDRSNRTPHGLVSSMNGQTENSTRASTVMTLRHLLVVACESKCDRSLARSRACTRACV